jgi:hypothetical protein
MSDFEDRLRDGLSGLAEGAEPPPTLWARIEARLGGGPGPNGRPPVALMAVAAAIVVVLVSLAVLSSRGGGKVVLTQGTSTTAGATTSTLGLAPGAPGASGVTTTPPTAAPTTAPATTTPTTTVNPTTTPAPTSTAPATTVAVVDCTTSDLKSVTTTDKGVYAPGQLVTITVMVTNVSGRTCVIQQPTANPFTPPLMIATGTSVVWLPAQLANGVIADIPKTVAPNGSYAWATVQWDQHQCVSPCTREGPEGAQVGAGPYVATPRGAPGDVTPATFTIQ